MPEQGAVSGLAPGPSVGRTRGAKDTQRPPTTAAPALVSAGRRRGTQMASLDHEFWLKNSCAEALALPGVPTDESAVPFWYGRLAVWLMVPPVSPGRREPR